MTVHIVASCTDRKRERPPAALCLHSIRAASLRERVEYWWDRLHRHNSTPIAAEDLYAGDHWAVVRSLPAAAIAAGLRPQLWIASAGYGFISASTLVRAYSATFGAGHRDSVAANGLGKQRAGVNREWWAELCRLRVERARPRSLAELSAGNPGAYIMIVASPDYVSALRDDLLTAAKELNRSARLLIVSADAPGLSELAPHVVPSDARLQARVGGARTSLHARVAREILQDAGRQGLEAPSVRARYERILARSPAPPSFDRDRLSDAEIRRFIREQKAKNGDVTHTGLLRLLRDGGHACEQSRFRALFLNETRRSHVS